MTTRSKGERTDLDDSRRLKPYADYLDNFFAAEQPLVIKGMLPGPTKVFLVIFLAIYLVALGLYIYHVTQKKGDSSIPDTPSLEQQAPDEGALVPESVVVSEFFSPFPAPELEYLEVDLDVITREVERVVVREPEVVMEVRIPQNPQAAYYAMMLANDAQGMQELAHSLIGQGLAKEVATAVYDTALEDLGYREIPWISVSYQGLMYLEEQDLADELLQSARAAILEEVSSISQPYSHTWPEVQARTQPQQPVPLTQAPVLVMPEPMSFPQPVAVPPDKDAAVVLTLSPRELLKQYRNLWTALRYSPEKAASDKAYVREITEVPIPAFPGKKLLFMVLADSPTTQVPLFGQKVAGVTLNGSQVNLPVGPVWEGKAEGTEGGYWWSALVVWSLDEPPFEVGSEISTDHVLQYFLPKK